MTFTTRNTEENPEMHLPKLQSWAPDDPMPDLGLTDYPQFYDPAGARPGARIDLPTTIDGLTDEEVASLGRDAVVPDDPDAIFLSCLEGTEIFRVTAGEGERLWFYSRNGEPAPRVVNTIALTWPTLTFWVAAYYKPGFGWGLHLVAIVAPVNMRPDQLLAVGTHLPGAAILDFDGRRSWDWLNGLSPQSPTWQRESDWISAWHGREIADLGDALAVDRPSSAYPALAALRVIADPYADARGMLSHWRKVQAARSTYTRPAGPPAQPRSNSAGSPRVPRRRRTPRHATH